MRAFIVCFRAVPSGGVKGEKGKMHKTHTTRIILSEYEFLDCVETIESSKVLLPEH